MTGNRRLAIIAGTLARGGAEKQLCYLLQTLRELGAEPHLLCLTAGEPLEAAISELGVPITFVGKSHNRAERLRQIIGAIRMIGPRAVQSQHFYTNLYAGLAGRLLGIRSIGALRNDVISEMADSGAVGGRLCLRLPGLLVANSEAAIHTATRLGVARHRLLLLRNTIETAPLASIAPPPMVAPIRITTIGRLVPQKRIDRFLRVLAGVIAASPVECRGTICGDGPERERLMSQATALGLDHRSLRFAGRVDNPLAILRETDILLLLSDWEGVPNVVLEAMAAARPVIATAVGDLPMIIDHGRSGFCLPSESAPENEAAAAVLGLIANPARAREIGAQARLRIESSFSLTDYPRQVATLYREAGVWP